jgi:hypothetical protein
MLYETFLAQLRVETAVRYGSAKHNSRHFVSINSFCPVFALAEQGGYFGRKDMDALISGI